MRGLDEIAQRDELAGVLVAELARKPEEARVAGRLAKTGQASEDLDLAAGESLALHLAHDLGAHFLEDGRVERRLFARELAELVGLDLLRQVARHFGLRSTQDEGVDRRAQALGGALVSGVDRPGVALLELVEGTEETRRDEVEDRPDLAQAVLDGCPAQGETTIRAQALGRARRGAQRVLDLLGLVDDDVAPVDLLEHLLVAPQERVARDDHVGVLELVLPLAALGPVPEGMAQRRREAVHLAEPVGHDARGGDDERLERLALALDLRVLVLHGEQQGERLDRLAEPHVVGQDAAAADLVEEP